MSAVTSAEDQPKKWENSMKNLSTANIDSPSQTVLSNNGGEVEEDEEEFNYGSKNAALLAAETYTVSLPIVASSGNSKSVGISLRQVAKGKILSDVAYSLDAQRTFDSTKSTVINGIIDDDSNNTANKNTPFILDDALLDNLDDNYEGVIVSVVIENGLAWNSGVRVGDTLVATSATMGDKIWPKSTLDGVRSSISSRKVMSSDMTFQFRRAGTFAGKSEVLEEFELYLTRPMGIKIDETKDGHVQVTGFTEGSQNSALCVGDRIVAVDSTLGNQMWPVSSAEGLVSACTTRLPGQPVKLRFQRMLGSQESDTARTRAAATASVNRSSQRATTIQNAGSKTNKLLLSRSCNLLQRYTSDQKVAASKAASAAGSTQSAMSAIPAVVADRVLDALATASSALDSKTLTLVMNAYLSCRMPEETISAFESAVGLASDGSISQITATTNDKAIITDVAALNLYSATSLLRAHALRGDIDAARRVLVAMEGRTDTLINGIVTADWPLSVRPDVRCYNMVLAAAAKAGVKKATEIAIDIFEQMADPEPNKVVIYSNENKITKTRVSYNTMIGVFAKAGRPQDALTTFYDMKKVGLKPDKYTYTSLLKALVEDGDIDGGNELLQEMTGVGIEADVVTYNTMIKALCDRLQWFKAKQLISKMELNGITPNSITYGLLMNGLLKASKPGPCLTLFEAASVDERTMGLMENVQLYTTAITAASQLGDHERAIELVSRMKKFGIKPNLKTLTALMSACLYANKIKYALDVYNQIVRTTKEDGAILQLDGYVLSLALKAYCENGDFLSASKLLTEQKDGYQEMSGKEIMSSYNYLINTALKRNDYAVAREALTELLQSGYIPSKITYENIIIGLDLDVLPKRRLPQNIQTAADMDDSKSKLEFLLFVLDSVGARKLTIGGTFYSAILTAGVRVGGMGRKVASLLGKARAQGIDGKYHENMYQDEIENQLSTWQNLLKDTTSSDNTGNWNEKDTDLPNIRVQIGKKEARLVLTAESLVVYKSRQRQRQFRIRKPSTR